MDGQTVTVNSEAKPETTEADATAAALQAAADGGVVVNGEQVVAPAAAPAETERPENVPEKFWDAKEGKVNVDAVLASNAELEKQFTQDKQDKTGEQEGETQDKTSEETNPVLSAQQEYEANGKLTDQNYADLEKVGLDRATVDAYIAGQQAVADGYMTHAYGLTEGEENFVAMNQWAAENLSEEELGAYNAQVVNPETSDYAVTQLYARFSENRPMETPLLSGDNTGAQSGEYFKSTAEMQAAMADKKYRSDPAFRAEVEQKIARADAAGVNLFL